MVRLIKSNVELQDPALEVLADAGFKKMGGGKKFINHDFEFKNLQEISNDLHDLDLHLDDSTRWENGKPVVTNVINQGYRCPKCNGLDLEPNLSCVKDIQNGIR